MEENSKVSVKNELNERPDWDTYFLRIAKLVAQRSTCIRRQVGAVIVRENRILATGYNGAPNGVAHCFQRPEGCLREAQHIPSGQRECYFTSSSLWCFSKRQCGILHPSALCNLRKNVD